MSGYRVLEILPPLLDANHCGNHNIIHAFILTTLPRGSSIIPAEDLSTETDRPVILIWVFERFPGQGSAQVTYEVCGRTGATSRASD